MRTFISSKIHGIRVTDKSVDYHGSVAIDGDLLREAGIEHYEQVAVVNLTNGERWETYAIPGGPGEFSLRGGGSRLGEIGDSCVILAYQQSTEFVGASVVFVDPKNTVIETMRYPTTTRQGGPTAP